MREGDMAEDLVISRLGNRQSDDRIKPSGSGTEFIIEKSLLRLFILATRQVESWLPSTPCIRRCSLNHWTPGRSHLLYLLH